MALQIMSLVRRDGGGSPPTRIYTEATTNTAQTGAIVALSAGALTPYSETSITTSVLGTNVPGLTTQPSIGTVGNEVPVNIAFPDVEFCLPVLTSGGTAATATKNMVGTTYVLRQETAGPSTILGVDKHVTSNGVFVITEVPDGEVGQTNGFVWGKIISGERSPGMI